MNRAIEIVSKLVAIGLIFIAPLIYLVQKFSNEEVIPEHTNSSMPLLILVMLSIVLILFISFLFSQLMAYMKDNPFGYSSIFFFGSLVATVSFLGISWINKLNDLVEYNTAQFMTDLEVYAHSMVIVLVYVLSGMIVGAVGLAYKKLR